MPEHVGLRELTLGLKPTQREVIDLLYFGGCTQVEAAEQLGIPRAARRWKRPSSWAFRGPR